MATVLSPVPPFRPAGPVHYPENDGNPMSDNTLQFDWIVNIKTGLDEIFADREDVFIAGDLLWYPVEGDNKTRVAPDAMVAFGRPKGTRGSYRQWEEDGIAPQVVFEVLSPGNTAAEMARKRDFYERFGVEEYYLYNPGDPRPGGDMTTELRGWCRVGPGSGLETIRQMDGWRSPRLDVVFELDQKRDLRLVRPDGRPFETFVELSQRAEQERKRAVAAQQNAEQERQRASEERQRADAAQQNAEQERQRADEERQRAVAAQQRADTLAARLRAAGIDPDVEG